MSDPQRHGALYHDLATSNAVASPPTSEGILTEYPSRSNRETSHQSREDSDLRKGSENTLTRDEVSPKSSDEERETDTEKNGVNSDSDKDLEKQKSNNEKEVKEEKEDKDPNLVEWDGDDDPVCTTLMSSVESNLIDVGKPNELPRTEKMVCVSAMSTDVYTDIAQDNHHRTFAEYLHRHLRILCL